jgi:hypothetical protein
MIRLQANPNGPDLFQLWGGFWPSSLPLFDGTARGSVFVAASMNNGSRLFAGADCVAVRGGPFGAHLDTRLRQSIAA